MKIARGQIDESRNEGGKKNLGNLIGGLSGDIAERALSSAALSPVVYLLSLEQMHLSL